jgi:hypothetical protein
MKVRLVFFLSVLLIAAGMSWRSSMAQLETEEYFDETGHRITGEFLDFYRKASNPLLLYGYPITDSFQDPTTETVVQYFQKARFELHPADPEGKRVQLSTLGEYMYQAGPPLPSPDNFTGCRDFPQTEHKVCYAFLQFFEAKGGVEQFGYPISNFELHDERIVQYFERTRFEWHPELPTGHRVILANLGRQYFDLRGENPVRLFPSRDAMLIQSIISLKVRAFPKFAVTGSNWDQTIYIIVQDQKMLPVADAQITLVVQWPSGKETRYHVPSPTDELGITRFTFPYKSRALGVVKVQVLCSYGNLDKQTVTSFRIWW